MRSGRGALVLVVALACASCAHPDTGTHSPPSTHLHSATTTTSPVSTTSAPAFGTRTLTVSGLSLSGGNWLTVGLHPTMTPVQLQATGTTPLEVCPAGLDGGLSDSSWPPMFKFQSCVDLSPSAVTTLPATDGGYHVAFAVKAVSPSAASPLTLTITYDATDSFVEVLPPATTGNITMTVSYTPHSATTGATATPVNRLTPAPGYALHVRQGGRALIHRVACDFPTELSSCFGGVAPGQPVEVQLTGHGNPVLVNLAWL